VDDTQTATKQADRWMVEDVWVRLGVDVSRMEYAKDNVSNG
jgi:hypothetical protein